MKLSGCCILLLLFQGFWLLPEAPAAQGEGAQPELDLLKERVTQFWTFIKDRNKADALEYVEPAGRNAFVYRREARILAFTLAEIQVGEDPLEAQVTVKIEIRTVTSTHSVTVPITERWLFRQGTWVVQIEGTKARELFSSPRAKVPVEDQKVPVPK
jgi:hypothetical protein